jgi:hypothetical protein
MVTYNRMIFSDRVDERQVAGHWVRKIGYMLDQALDYRLQGNNTARFTDIFYKNLITDSVSELEKIYRLNGGLTPSLTEQFQRHELENPHRKHGTHQYSMADFGISDADIEKHTSRYGQFISEHYGSQHA